MTLPVDAAGDRIRRRRRYALTLAVSWLVLLGCAEPEASPPTVPATTASPFPTGQPTAEPRVAGTFPPRWLGTRALPRRADGFGEIRPTPPALRHRRFTLPDTVDPLPGDGFASRIEPAPPEVISRSTWVPGCPIGADELAWVRLTFWGFDDARHTGELLVNATVAEGVVAVFKDLYAARFPIEQMTIVTPADPEAPPYGDGNGTGGFVCRPVVGQSVFSEHAYGLAIDVNPFQNPYVKGSGAGRIVLPELASAYLDRGRGLEGMIEPDGAVVRVFRSIGWTWGGNFRTLKDYQHFSLRGR